MKRKIEFILLFATVALIITGCKKDSSGGATPPAISKRVVKYEITGNYTGELIVVYNDNVNGTTSLIINSLPWSKSLTYANNVLVIGIGGDGVASKPGVPGQTVTLRIYSGGEVVKSSTKVAGLNGIAISDALTYQFP